jgi:hypothetical protein
VTGAFECRIGRRTGERRSRGLRLSAAVILGASCGLFTAFAAGGSEDPELNRAGASVGIWKAVVPPAAMYGEFANHDPLGLAAGVAISADCSINWVDPDAGKLYCFSSATSLVVFLDAPHAYLKRARAQWLHLENSAR